jgi:hypothetical protein
MIQARDCELSLVFDLQLPLSFTYNCFIFILCLPKERNEESAPCRKPSGCRDAHAQATVIKCWWHS